MNKTKIKRRAIYFEVKYEGKPVEFISAYSHLPYLELAVNLWNELSTRANRIKGYALVSIDPATEIQYQTWSLAISLNARLNKIEFDQRNKFMKHANEYIQRLIASDGIEFFNRNKN